MSSPPSKPLQFSFSSKNLFLSCILQGNSRLVYRAVVTHSTISREMLTDTSSLRGLISRSLAILLAVGIGGIHSVEICRSKGVKCL